MINTYEILETIKMIRQENLDIRTITMGISLLDCSSESVEKTCENIYNKIISKAKNLVSVGKEIEKEFGIPIINKRISVTPVSLLTPGESIDDYVSYAMTLDKIAMELGIDFIGGYSALVQKGCTRREEIFINSIPYALSKTSKVCSSVKLSFGSFPSYKT